MAGLYDDPFGTATRRGTTADGPTVSGAMSGASLTPVRGGSSLGTGSLVSSAPIGTAVPRSGSSGTQPYAAPTLQPSAPSAPSTPAPSANIPAGTFNTFGNYNPGYQSSPRTGGGYTPTYSTPDYVAPTRFDGSTPFTADNIQAYFSKMGYAPRDSTIPYFLDKYQTDFQGNTDYAWQKLAGAEEFPWNPKPGAGGSSGDLSGLLSMLGGLFGSQQPQQIQVAAPDMSWVGSLMQSMQGAQQQQPAGLDASSLAALASLMAPGQQSPTFAGAQSGTMNQNSNSGNGRLNQALSLLSMQSPSVPRGAAVGPSDPLTDLMRRLVGVQG
jgi:hypothetical protein